MQTRTGIQVSHDHFSVAVTRLKWRRGRFRLSFDPQRPEGGMGALRLRLSLVRYFFSRPLARRFSDVTCGLTLQSPTVAGCMRDSFPTNSRSL